MLGVALLEADAPALILARLRADDFYLEKHRTLYRAMARVAQRLMRVDVITMAEALRQADALDDIGGLAYLGQLMEEATLAISLPDYCQMIRDKAGLRELIQLGASLVTRGYTNGAAAVDILQAAGVELSRVADRGLITQPAAMQPLADILTTPPAHPIWLVEHLLLEAANGWIGAGAKVGKSYLVLDLLIACALGKPWLDTFQIPRPLRVCLVEEEDSAWRVYERAARLCTARGETPPASMFMVAIRKGLQVDNEASLRPLLDELHRAHVDLVAWDVFNKIHTQDEKRPDQMLPILKRLDRLRDEFGCANVVLHHARKLGASGLDLATGGQQLRGPSEFWGWAENSLYLKPLTAKGAIIIEPESKDALAAPFKAHLDDVSDDARRWVYDGPVAAKVSAGDALRTRLLEALALHPMTVAQLMEHTGSRERSLKQHLTALRGDGAVEYLREPGSAGRKLWMLPATGQPEASPPF